MPDSSPLPWFIAGPLIGLTVPLLLVVGNRAFGVSGNLRHICTATIGRRARGPSYFQYDWRRAGLWNLTFAAGVLLGGFLAGYPQGEIVVGISDAARGSLAGLGVTDTTGLVPAQLFSWAALASWRSLVLVVGGGFLVGFGTAWAGGCTSGHAITGISSGQLPSVVATCSFFAGGLLATWLLLPLLLG